MFCAKCGVTLAEQAGQPLTCVAGQMPLSQDLERRLRAYYVEGARLGRHLSHSESVESGSVLGAA